MEIFDDYLNKNKAFIVAELSANHKGKLSIALDSIEAAKEAGADAIKIQTYTPDSMTINIKKGEFLVKFGNNWDGLSLYDLYKEAYTPYEWHQRLFEKAKESDITIFSTPFDIHAVDFLDNLNNPIYKISSFEITDIPLIKYAASKGKPIIISTGIATKNDITNAVNTCRSVGNNKIILLKTTSQYPAQIDDANLNFIPYYSKKFKVVSGLSDHTLGLTVPMVARSLGALVIEKHFILNKKIKTPDSAFSIDIKEFRQMVNAVRDVEKSMGTTDFTLSDKTRVSRKYRRSLYVVEDVKKGEVFTDKNVKSIRPGLGMHPKHYENVLGKTAIKVVKKGTPLRKNLMNE
ncbi:MAG: pseudaminic acid synthase [Bacteroidetes bacterium GWF2_38_335]|nr:MAG: pseudaminic acid synthase [Bacteroidetes bacterium GWF2_38_335]OFY77109.1 MAG: pseudaminic acid synthase [Bacteroidetes bacterium RIFOXYA12_FULL_38_20]HBS85000.1 pseudaminic acid synthase [Bacteroidales bacterium]